jgi:Flp pilus assembly protein TadD
MRGFTLGLLIVLAACSPRGSTGVGTGPPGLDIADNALHGGSPELALQISSNILVQHPGNEAALLTRGEALTALGRPDEAAASFQAALAANPQSVGAMIGLGRLRLASDPAGAEQLFLDALSHEPRNGVALNDLGIARDLQGRHGEAQAVYRQALGVNPDMTAAQVNLALSLAMGGQPQQGVQLLRPLADAPGATRQVRHDLAAVLTMSGDRAGAQRILSKDLPPNEVQQALDAFASAQPNAAATLLAGGAPAETPAALTLATPPSGGILVQLAGASPSREDAERKWQLLQRQMPDLLQAREPTIAEVARNGQPTWRVRTSGFAAAADATTFCDQVRKTGTTCILVQDSGSISSQ